jgi:hypothetical protein
MATWKKVVVSGSQAELARLNVGANQQISGSAADTFLSGSFSGSFAGNGQGLTNIPYSALTGAPVGGGSGNVITSGSYSASFSTGPAGAFNVTVTSSLDSSTVTLLTVSSSGIVKAKEAFTTGNVTGSRSFLSGLTYSGAGGAVTFKPIDPTEIKSWADGDSPTGNSSYDWNTSIFAQLVNEDTPISDILYFLLRPYAAFYQVAGPNTATWSTITGTINTTPTDAVYTSQARVPQGDGPVTMINTLRTDGWHTNGGQLWGNIPAGGKTNSIFANNAYWAVTSTRTGTTANQSNANAFGLGPLVGGAVTGLFVSASVNYRTLTGASFGNTFTSASLLVSSRTSTGTSADGVYISAITPAAGPAEYQDGYFSSTNFGQHIRHKHAISQGATISAPTDAASSIGYYEVSASIFIATSSGAGGTGTIGEKASPSGINYIRNKYLYVPASVTGLSQTHTTITSTRNAGLITNTMMSSSLSGAPYLYSASYYYSESVANVFEPLYSTGTVYSEMAATSIAAGSSVAGMLTTTTALGAVTIGGDGTISTADRVYDSTGVTLRNTSTVPYYNDIIVGNCKAVFDATQSPTVESNVGLTLTGVTSPTITFNGSNITYPGGSAVITNTTRNIFTTSDPGYPGPIGVNGGSVMAWRKRTQSYTNRPANMTSFTATEDFLAESRRLQITNDMLTINSALPWSTTFGLNTLSAGDLQVKPGYLVTPGGNNGYWINDPGSTAGYYYYATVFSIEGLTTGGKTSIDVTLGGTTAIVAWNDTSSNNAIGVALLPQSSDATNNDADSVASFIDAATISGGDYISSANQTTGLIAGSTAGLNPFSTSIRMWKNTTGAELAAGSSYRVGLSSLRYHNLNSNAADTRKFIILIRYKGNPTPITSITVTCNS